MSGEYPPRSLRPHGPSFIKKHSKRGQFVSSADRSEAFKREYLEGQLFQIQRDYKELGPDDYLRMKKLEDKFKETKKELLKLLHRQLSYAYTPEKRLPIYKKIDKVENDYLGGNLYENV